MALGRVEDSPIFEPDIDVVGPSEMPVRGVWEKTVLPSFPKWPLFSPLMSAHPGEGWVGSYVT